MKKLILFMLILSTAAVMESCSSSNGDRAKSGNADTVGAVQNSGSVKDSTNGLKDTLKHK